MCSAVVDNTRDYPWQLQQEPLQLANVYGVTFSNNQLIFNSGCPRGPTGQVRLSSACHPHYSAIYKLVALSVHCQQLLSVFLSMMEHVLQIPPQETQISRCVSDELGCSCVPRQCDPHSWRSQPHR